MGLYTKPDFETMPDIDRSCLFFSIPTEQIIAQNELSYAILDGFPVTHLHALVIPTRHVEDYFAPARDESFAHDALLRRVREKIIQADPWVQGFNIGVNAGAVAGQTIFHCHIHLIPRRQDDVENPRGGVRHVIPERAFTNEICLIYFLQENPALED